MAPGKDDLSSRNADLEKPWAWDGVWTKTGVFFTLLRLVLNGSQKERHHVWGPNPYFGHVHIEVPVPDLQTQTQQRRWLQNVFSFIVQAELPSKLKVAYFC